MSPELQSASQQLLILIKKGWNSITTYPVPPHFITVHKGDSVFFLTHLLNMTLNSFEEMRVVTKADKHNKIQEVLHLIKE